MSTSRGWVGVSWVVPAVAACVFHPAMAQSTLEKTTVAYRKVDGVEILADVYRPRSQNLCPVIVYIHGGALIMGNREELLTYGKRVLSFAQQRGYAIVSIDYRLAPETKLPAIISDIESAFTWIGTDGAARFHLDTNRMVVFGGSAGGYLALVTGYRVSPRPKALVVLYGYGELNAQWYAKPNPYAFYNMKRYSREDAMRQTDGTVISDAERRHGSGADIYLYYRQNGLWPREVSGFAPDSLAQQIAMYEPVRHVSRGYPPTLLIHGTQDTDVPFEESVKMSQQFVKHGVPYILRPIDKADHTFTGGDPGQIEDAYGTMQEFMMKYLEPN